MWSNVTALDGSANDIPDPHPRISIFGLHEV
jgi:hypothetical protein